jgi:Myb/SANT-like DNA-binding domain
MNIRWFSNYPHSTTTTMPPKKARKKAIVEPASEASSPAPDSMSTAKPKSTRAPNVIWSNEDIQSILTQLKEAKARGDTSENGFKPHVWKAIEQNFGDLLKKKDRVCKTKWFRVKKDYKMVKYIRELSGFGWDNNYYLPITDNSIWDTLITVSSLFLIVIQN